jgi:spoIIIJ-associated protein
VQDVVSKMGILTDVIIDENREFTKMTLTGKNMGILIGRRGETLDALQYLVNLVANKNIRYDRKKIIIDAEGYRERREETLVRLAHRLAERVRRTGIKLVLEPMNPQERRIIHTTLQDDIYVQTYSEGEDPFRRIVISLR